MENATDALMIGFAVLAFVLALSLTIGAFSQVTAVTDDMIEAQETTYSDVDYDSAERIVSAETIVPALYRAYEENYIIRFYYNNTDKHDALNEKDWKKNCRNPYNFLNIQSVGSTNEINLRKMTFGTAKRANQFVSCLLGKGSSFEVLSYDYEAEEMETEKVDFNERYSFINVPSDDFYEVLRSHQWKETLGIYYEEDATENGVAEGVDDVNKTEVRIITYTCLDKLENNANSN